MPGRGGLGAGGIDWCIREFKTVLDSGFHNVDSTPRIPVSRYLIPVWIPIASGITDSKLHEKNKPFFVLYFFTLGESVILVSLAHFPRFCWQYFSLSNAFSIHLARKTYFLLCSGFWNIFLTFLLLFRVQIKSRRCWQKTMAIFLNFVVKTALIWLVLGGFVCVFSKSETMHSFLSQSELSNFFVYIINAVSLERACGGDGAEGYKNW